MADERLNGSPETKMEVTLLVHLHARLSTLGIPQLFPSTRGAAVAEGAGQKCVRRARPCVQQRINAHVRCSLVYFPETNVKGIRINCNRLTDQMSPAGEERSPALLMIFTPCQFKVAVSAFLYYDFRRRSEPERCDTRH